MGVLRFRFLRPFTKLALGLYTRIVASVGARYPNEKKLFFSFGVLFQGLAAGYYKNVQLELENIYILKYVITPASLPNPQTVKWNVYKPCGRSDSGIELLLLNTSLNSCLNL